GNAHDRAWYSDRRARDCGFWGERFSISPERSILVSSLRRRPGHGLAFFGHHDFSNGCIKAWFESTVFRAWPCDLRWAWPAFAADSPRTARLCHEDRPEWRGAGAYEPTDSAGRQQRDRRWIPALSALVRHREIRRVGNRAARHEFRQSSGPQVPLALGNCQEFC